MAAGAAAWLADHYNFPIILLGLLIGLALNFAAQDKRVHAGLDLASGLFLRIGIVLLGFQVTVAEVATLGWAGFGAILLIMVLTFGAGVLGARISGQSPYAGIIAGGATAKCQTNFGRLRYHFDDRRNRLLHRNRGLNRAPSQAKQQASRTKPDGTATAAQSSKFM